jgi:medium-chain acyl-[acyl-carrier-protein] hydrolase
MDIQTERLHYAKSWIHRPRPALHARLFLFCFPYLGGGAAVYYHWPKGLPPDVEVCAIRLPGRESRLRETPFTRLYPLAVELAHVLQPLLDRPFAFFGHSMGAIISFEVARQLRRERLPLPMHLFISGCMAPHLARRRMTHALPEREFIDELQKYGALPQEVLQEPELMRLYLPMLRADMEMLVTYEHWKEVPLECAISAFAGLSDHAVSPEDVLSWNEHTTGLFDFHLLPGDHFFLQSSREQLLQLVSLDLVRDIDVLES